MIKKIVFCLATICVVTLTGCDCSPDVSENIGSHEDNLGNDTYESAETTRDVILLQGNEDIIANPNNLVDNGFIIINDPNDYPEFIEELRYCENISDNLYSVTNFYGDEVFKLESVFCPIFVDDLSPFSEDGINFGYIDINGNIVIEAKYSKAGYFCNGTALVADNSNEFYIDTNGQITENTKFYGYEGAINDFTYCNAFTGKYLMYCRTDNDKRIYGYAEKNGALHDLNEFRVLSSFNGEYAFVSDISGNSFFINTNFEQVTRDIKNDLYYDIDFCENDWCGARYIFEDGYFVATIRNESTGYVPQKKLLKICPELYTD